MQIMQKIKKKKPVKCRTSMFICIVLCQSVATTSYNFSGTLPVTTRHKICFPIESPTIWKCLHRKLVQNFEDCFSKNLFKTMIVTLHLQCLTKRNEATCCFFLGMQDIYIRHGRHIASKTCDWILQIWFLSSNNSSLKQKLLDFQKQWRASSAKLQMLRRHCSMSPTHRQVTSICRKQEN